METINLTPTWESLVPAMLDVYNSDSIENKKMILEEFIKMAKCADLYLANN